MIHKLRKLAGRGRFCLEYVVCSLRSRIVLSAGMPRSGSTWLYNAARLLLREQHGAQLGCGWIGDWRSLPRKRALLLKVHDYGRLLANRAAVVLYSYRDVRDALASNKRKFDVEPSLTVARTWLDQERRWRAAADFLVRYETMITNPEPVVQDLARVLGVKNAPMANIARELKGLRARVGSRRHAYHPESLLHQEHITDGRHMSWHNWLSANLVRQLEAEFREWFVANDYPLVVQGEGDRRSWAA